MKPMLKAPGTKRLKLICDDPLSDFAFKFNLRRYNLYNFRRRCMNRGSCSGGHSHGRAVQVDSIKPKLKASGNKRLKLKYDELLSNFAFNFNLRRFTTAAAARGGGAGV